jgi:hypothetical protein
MNLIILGLRYPVTLLVVVLALCLGASLAVRRMPVDLFPNLNLPVIYVAQPYGGMDPSQMESYLVSYYEYHFLYVTGIEHVESRSIQNVGLVKLFFHPETDMSQALAQVVSYVERSRAFMRRSLRRRERAGGTARLFERDTDLERDPGSGAVPGAPLLLDAAGSLGPAPLWRESANGRHSY